jgi:hypothetical protein
MTEPMKNPFDGRNPLAVTDGRETVGYVERNDDGTYTALDADGAVIGRFDSCLAAARAVNPKGARK